MPQGLPFKDCVAHGTHLKTIWLKKSSRVTIHSTRYEGGML